MDPILNPYAPGAGERPAALVGRDRQLAAWDVTLERAERDKPRQPFVLHGLRGVGKTVLLNELRSATEARGWLVAQVEAGNGRALRDMLSDDIQRRLARHARRESTSQQLLRALKTARSFKITVDPTGNIVYGLDVSGIPIDTADSGDLELDLAILAEAFVEAAREQRRGAAIFIDEAQDLEPEELQALCAIAHRAAQERVPFLLALAGLPSLPRLLAEARSYAERLFAFHPIGRLDPRDARAALAKPADAEGVTWTEDALARTIEYTDGYPYFLQIYGGEAWNLATGPDIAVDDVDAAAPFARRTLDGFYRSRYARATNAEREYLIAMSADGDGGSRSGEVAARLGRSLGSLGPARANLISKGLVYAPEHGEIHFTVPGMAAFIATEPQ